MSTANNFKVVDFIGKNVLARTVNSLAFAHTANRDWVNPWGASNDFKIGDTLRIRKPVYFTSNNGAELQVQGIIENQDTLTINYQKHVDIALTSVDVQRFLQDPETNIYEGAAQELANQIDAVGAQTAASRVWRTIGTAGAGITSFATPNLSVTTQRKYGVVNSRYMTFNPGDAGSLRASLQNSFNKPFNENVSQYARLGEVAGHDLIEDQNLAIHTTGTFAGTALVNGALQSGSTINLKGFTASQSGVLNVGDVISFANVYGLNPISRLQVGTGSGNLAQFVVQEVVNSDGSGLATVSILPAIVLSGPYQNVTTAAADSAAVSAVGITVPGTAAQWSNNYTYSPDAFTLACVPPPIMMGAPYCKVFTDPETNISIRCTVSYNPVTDQDIMRFDVFFGWQVFGQYCTRQIG
jgi:hypothetical protein